MLKDVLKHIEQRNRFVLTSHARPDGDAIGSALACRQILRAMGKEADVVLRDGVPRIYQPLPFAREVVQKHRQATFFGEQFCRFGHPGNVERVEQRVFASETGKAVRIGVAGIELLQNDKCVISQAPRTIEAGTRGSADVVKDLMTHCNGNARQEFILLSCEIGLLTG